ncbi:response regulator [Paenibacillus sp. H1-7]|uniref:response regulator transcription factor n=1 Tax=Paenibacillus sp. H1-7 TaxID=2282849 RepID=UPI001EF88F50|nr:response regulator [Paenibacillus sp. H1-7]ULL17103.1 response regulator [Paenibacillus sp. H1-7]
MYHILIVDDEPRIVNMLYEQLLDWRLVELEVYRAYSAPEALSIIESTKIHIVLTDIHMPGITGLELQAKINKLWPRCKVIFLTGYNDFDYIQQAMRNGAFDFILKIEEDDAIIAAVNKALTSLQNEMVLEQYMYRAEQQLQAARPMLQKEYLWSLLQGEMPRSQVTSERFQELYFPLTRHAKVMLVAGRIDQWPDGTRPTDKSLLHYALENIAVEYLDSTKHMICSFPTSNFVWFIQPKNNKGEIGEAEWRACVTFVQGTMSDIQSTYEKLMKLPISLSVSSAPVDWLDVPVQYVKLQQSLWMGLGPGDGIIVSEQDSQSLHGGGGAHGMGRIKQEVVLHLRKVKQLQTCLESGDKEPFAELYKEITELAHSCLANSDYHPYVIELQHALIAAYLSHINQSELMQTLSERMNMEPLLGKRCFQSWEEAETYFTKLADLLFSVKGHEQRNRTGRILTSVNQYIEQHLADNLSLDVLADLVALHPAYLSRLYKQSMGMRLSDYIKTVRLNKAKELLVHTHLKIHEVAVQVGFETSYYFSKVFKKEMLLTPQEYRERHVN